MSRKIKLKGVPMKDRSTLVSSVRNLLALGVAVLLLSTFGSATAVNTDRYYQEEFEEDDGGWMTYGYPDHWEHAGGMWEARIHSLESDPFRYPETKAVLVSPVFVLGDNPSAWVNIEAKVVRDDITASIELVDAVTKERQVLWYIGGDTNIVGSTQSSLYLDLPRTTSGTATLQFVLESVDGAYYRQGGDKYFDLKGLIVDTDFSV